MTSSGERRPKDFAETNELLDETRRTETKVVRLPVPLADLSRRLADRVIRAGDINGFIDVEGVRAQTVPSISTSVDCGFPPRPTITWTARSTSTS